MLDEEGPTTQTADRIYQLVKRKQKYNKRTYNKYSKIDEMNRQ
jgi:hypothetical protein